MTEEEAAEVFARSGAILSGHFVLTSGRHSDRYVQCARVLEIPALTSRLAREIAERFSPRPVDLVASPAVGGIVIGFAVAQALDVPFIFSEREAGRMRFRRSFQVPSGARVLVVEDVVTTGGSVAELIELVEEQGGCVEGVASLIDRGRTKAFDEELTSLLRLDVASWEPEECPLCRAGEPTSMPGSRSLG
jgi:orotate phosphoribosyltransferase